MLRVNEGKPRYLNSGFNLIPLEKGENKMTLEELKQRTGHFILVKLFMKEVKKEDGGYYTFKKCYLKLDNETIFFETHLKDKETRLLFTKTLKESKTWVVNLTDATKAFIDEIETYSHKTQKTYKQYRLNILDINAIEVVNYDN